MGFVSHTHTHTHSARTGYPCSTQVETETGKTKEQNAHLHTSRNNRLGLGKRAGRIREPAVALVGNKYFPSLETNRDTNAMYITET